MFIQNAVWASVNIANLEAPLLEGTVLDKDGQIVFVPGEAGGGTKSTKSLVMQAPYGIVPETVSVFPPTMMVNVCIGGTINIDLPGNEVMNDFTDDIMTQLGEDFNFVKFNEHTGGGGDGLPSYDANDIGKVLTVVSQSETGAEAIPAQTVTIAQGTATVQNANVSQWTEGQSLQVIYRGTMYTGKITDAEGSLVFGTDDFVLTYDSSTGVLTVEDIEHSGDNSISALYVTEHANADWGEGVPTPTAADTGKVLTANNGAVEWAASGNTMIVGSTLSGTIFTFNKTFQEIYDAFTTGKTVILVLDNADSPIIGEYAAVIGIMNNTNSGDKYIYAYFNETMQSLYCDRSIDYPTYNYD